MKILDAYSDVVWEQRRYEIAKDAMVGIIANSHKDENPANDCINNLEWCSYKYNTNYGTCKERIAKANGLKIEQYTLDGKYVTTFDSVADAGRALGKKPSAIAVVARGGGYWSRGK